MVIEIVDIYGDTSETFSGEPEEIAAAVVAAHPWVARRAHTLTFPQMWDRVAKSQRYHIKVL